MLFALRFQIAYENFKQKRFQKQWFLLCSKVQHLQLQFDLNAFNIYFRPQMAASISHQVDTRGRHPYRPSAPGAGRTARSSSWRSWWSAQWWRVCPAVRSSCTPARRRFASPGSHHASTGATQTCTGTNEIVNVCIVLPIKRMDKKYVVSTDKTWQSREKQTLTFYCTK